MELTNLTDESAEYRSAREELLLAEIDLLRHRERVAGLRRALPPGPVVPDYEFLEPAGAGGPERRVRLSELFTGPGRPLIVYHYMFGKRQTSPCPMCSMWIDGFDGVARHVDRTADFVVVAAADGASLREVAHRRGWSSVRLLSAGTSTFKLDFASEDGEGNQDSRVSVFVRDDDGTVRHSYTAAPRMSDDVDQRGIDLLCPTWHLLDLTPGGRGDWYPSLTYDP
jgi:predicted dithiol-disulfide oxidoreductase (DUF899 family)